jgi:hypothetical protein
MEFLSSVLKTLIRNKHTYLKLLKVKSMCKHAHIGIQECVIKNLYASKKTYIAKKQAALNYSYL